jgi:hypothetical protein
MFKFSIKILKSVVALMLIAMTNNAIAYAGYEGTIQVENSTSSYCLLYDNYTPANTTQSFYMPPGGLKAPVQSGLSATWLYANGGTTTISGTLTYSVYSSGGIYCKTGDRSTKLGQCTFAFTVDPYGVTTYDPKTSCNVPDISLSVESSNAGKILTFRIKN